MNPQSVLEEFSSYPRFDDGRIDYTDAPKAASIHVIIRCKDEILLVKRSENVSLYQGLWSGVTGYYDEPVPLQQKASEELTEELGFDLDVEFVDVFTWADDREWVTFLGRASIDEKPAIQLNEENAQFAWVELSEIDAYELLPGTKRIVRRLFNDV